MPIYILLPYILVGIYCAEEDLDVSPLDLEIDEDLMGYSNLRRIVYLRLIV
jgi:hypothetical protein